MGARTRLRYSRQALSGSQRITWRKPNKCLLNPSVLAGFLVNVAGMAMLIFLHWTGQRFVAQSSCATQVSEGLGSRLAPPRDEVGTGRIEGPASSSHVAFVGGGTSPRSLGGYLEDELPPPFGEVLS